MDKFLWDDFWETVQLSSPTFVSLFVGLVVAWAYRRHSRPALFAGLGCGCLIVDNLAAIYWGRVLRPILFDRGELRFENAVSFGFSALEAVGFTFFLLAVFSGRLPARYRRLLERFSREDEEERAIVEPSSPAPKR